jgi:hypothetical protein
VRSSDCARSTVCAAVALQPLEISAQFRCALMPQLAIFFDGFADDMSEFDRQKTVALDH